MKTCPKCFNPSNPDNATECQQGCGFKFDQVAEKYLRLCPSGKHQMDPTWETCAFCRAEGIGSSSPASKETIDESSLSNSNAGAYSAAGGGTAFDAMAHGARPAEAESRPASASRKTALDQDLPDLRRPSASSSGSTAGMSQSNESGAKPRADKTVFGAAAPDLGPSKADKPKIVGVLATFTWRADGQVFYVREGRNKIGRAGDCDIVVEHDHSLSGWNTSITYRSGRFTITGKDSMNGTFVNSDEVIAETTTALPNYATIRVGSTTFRFVALDPPAVD